MWLYKKIEPANGQYVTCATYIHVHNMDDMCIIRILSFPISDLNVIFDDTISRSSWILQNLGGWAPVR